MTLGNAGGQRMLVNFFYAHPVGHAVEALHYCLGHHAADPSREISVVLNAATAVELADYCPFLTAAYPVDQPLLTPSPDSAARQAQIPKEWDWVLDDFRRAQGFQLGLFPGLRDFYAASDARLTASQGRSVVGSYPPGYAPHQQLRFQLPAAAQADAARRFETIGWDGAPGRIALMPAGSSESALYPSVSSWELILDALTEAYPGLEIVLVGKLAQGPQTSTSITAAGLHRLLSHRSGPLDGFDLPLGEQLAIVEASDVFLAPHTGFGLAALAVGTPWLALSGGRWFEYFFNRVPFRSLLPDVERYPSFSQFDAAAGGDPLSAEPPVDCRRRDRLVGGTADRRHLQQRSSCCPGDLPPPGRAGSGVRVLRPWRSAAPGRRSAAGRRRGCHLIVRGSRPAAPRGRAADVGEVDAVDRPDAGGVSAVGGEQVVEVLLQGSLVIERATEELAGGGGDPLEVLLDAPPRHARRPRAVLAVGHDRS
jgi:hypothetical protein